MNIPNEAVEAAAEAMYEFKYDNKSWDEAKVPDTWRAHALVTLEAAVPHILKQRRQESRAARAEARPLWEEQARLDREAARAAMEADLNKHFPLIEDWLDDGYQVSCDATGCDFSTDKGHYGAIMTQWNGHIAEILSIAGSPK